MRLLVVLVIAFLSHGVRAQEAVTPPPAEPTTLRFKVDIEAPRTYRKMLEEGLDLVRWQRDERVTLPLLERLVAEARKATADALAADGYLTPDVQSEIRMRSPNEALVQLKVSLGPRTVVRKIDIDVVGPAAEEAEGKRRIAVVKETWRLAPGQPFRQSQWDGAKEDAVARLARGRYAAAAIAESEARLDAGERTADLKLKLDSGPVFYAGPSEVQGLKRYPASVVENLNPIKQGEPYDAVTLDLFQRRLLETGYFNAVHFVIEPDPKQAAAAPLLINVIEAPAHRIDTGLAFSTDTGFGVTLDYTHADLFGSAWRLRPRVNVNQREQQVNVNVDTPPRPGGTWQTYSTKVQRRDIENEVSREIVVGAAHNWGLESTPSQVALSGHIERQSIEGSTTEHNHAVFVAYRKTFRTTDDLVLPRRGLLGTAEIGASVPGISSQEFIRVRGKLNWLIPFGLRNDVLVRGEAGAVLAQSREGVVSSFLFRTGGDQTIRGYDFESIGVPQGTATVGGRYMALGSVEYTRWITDALGAAIFVDAGDAFDQTGAFDLAIGYGVGVRWRSPIGPFRADVAYGERSSKVQLHFSVGYSF